MGSNVQKTPLARTLEQFTARKIGGALALEGQSLPASVVSVQGSGIVTVKFEIVGPTPTLPNMMVPVAGSEYVRLPIQPGCLGWVMSADTYLGGVSGLGGGVADLKKRANLSMLVFSPIGNKNWSPSEDPNSLVLYGPDGVIIRNAASTSSIKITPAGEVLIAPKAGQQAQVDGPATVTGDVTAQANVDATTGNITAAQGNITATEGNIVAAAGGISAPAGVISGLGLAAAALSITGSSVASNANPLLTAAGDVVTTGGFVETEFPIPTPANGSTVTLDPTKSQFQSIINNVAAFTFAPATLSTNETATIIVRMINGASAGTPLFTGMKQWPSAALDTTNGHQFAIVFYIWAGIVTAYTIQALQ